MRKWPIALAVFAVALSGAATVASRPRDSQSPAPGIAIAFPEKIEGYQRTRLEQGNNGWIADYRLVRDGRLRNLVTITVYPARAGKGCYDDFKASIAATMKAHPGARDLYYDSPFSPDWEWSDAASLERFSFTASYDGKAQALLSELYVYCNFPTSKWWLIARATWPEGERVEMGMPTILHAISWPPEVVDPNR